MEPPSPAASQRGSDPWSSDSDGSDNPRPAKARRVESPRGGDEARPEPDDPTRGPEPSDTEEEPSDAGGGPEDGDGAEEEEPADDQTEATGDDEEGPHEPFERNPGAGEYGVVQGRPRSKHWCFTLNNYTPEDEERIQTYSSTPGVYLVYGREIGESGTPHLQGFVSFPSRKRMTEAIAVIGQSHFSIARCIPSSIRYCKKDGDFFENGEPPQPPQKGKRNDLENFKADVKAGCSDTDILMENHSGVFARYRNFALSYIKMIHTKKPPVEAHELRPWQSELNGYLNGPVDPREIVFLVDRTGNSGKSWFFRYYQMLHERTTQIIIPGKKADMALVLREDNRVVLFDCPRSKQGDFIQYDFLEEIKNGYVMSGKYVSEVKAFVPPHVVVAMNEHPDYEKLSEDRFRIIEI